MTSDAFAQTVDDLGEEAFGVRWLALRPTVHRWIENNPERVMWLGRRIRRLVREGRL